MKKLTLTSSILIAAILGASGCQTLDPYTNEVKTSNTVKGGAIGAGVGAVLGYITSKDKDRRARRKAILLGAGLGGLTGAGIGYYMDQQEARLRAKLQGTGVSVTRVGDEIILNMPGNVTFATGSSDMRSSFYEVMDSVVLVLNEFDKTLIECAGHTDSVGSEASNQALSERRAATVGSYLRSRGISSQRILTVGYGETRPVASNATAAGRQQNRRVELTLIPIRSQG